MALPRRKLNMRTKVEREMDMFARECKHALARFKKVAQQAERMGAPEAFQHELLYIIEVMEVMEQVEGMEYPDIPVKVGTPKATDPTLKDWVEAIFTQHMPTKKHRKRQYVRKKAGTENVKCTRTRKLKEKEIEPIQPAEGITFSFDFFKGGK